jgi:uncharacterized membrane protein
MNMGLIATWRIAAIGAAFALLALVLAWHLLPTPTLGDAIVAIVLSIPLIAPLPGLWRGNRYTYRWATLCVVPYFIVGLTEVIANPVSRIQSAAMLVLALAWFVTLVAYLRVTRVPSATN